MERSGIDDDCCERWNGFQGLKMVNPNVLDCAEHFSETAPALLVVGFVAEEPAYPKKPVEQPPCFIVPAAFVEPDCNTMVI